MRSGNSTFLILGLGGAMVLSAQMGPRPVVAAAATAAAPALNLQRMAKLLNLTEAQVTAIKAIYEKHAPVLKTRALAVAEARKALRTAALDPTAGAATLHPLFLAVSEAEFAGMMERRAQEAEVAAQLTPDQKDKWDHLRAMLRRRAAKA
jgi:Spy/CpxP family protein refolding chaperone